ncbi:MAG: bifunctional prephenate dehydrogenase/3-phosphoshikimate 1-carboxyvinyltransferase [Pseudohongiellaceae bacterium]
MTQFAQQTVAILGLGLIGGSIARGLRDALPGIRLLAVDSDQQALEQAIEEGVIDGASNLEDVAGRADLLILATPPLVIETLLPQLSAAAHFGLIITDVGSAKSHISSRLLEIGGNFAARFVPGHPIAGSEQSGYGASRGNLFAGRNVILTPLAMNEPAAVATVHSLWRYLGAEVLAMSVNRHDRVLAATSHLPHALAFTLVDALLNQEHGDDIFRYAAGGFADFSRLASSNATMWSDVFIANAEATGEVLEDYIAHLQNFRRLMQDGDRDALQSLFQRAKQTRDHFMQHHFSTGSAQNMESEPVSLEVTPGGTVTGTIRVPGDKSISHRSIIFASLADGVTRISGFLEGEDALNTVAAFREMGVTIVGPEDGELTVYGVGINGLQAPRKPLYMGNSGTAMRLLAGLLAAQDFDSELTGDESLSKRPMNRVAEPLRRMGAKIQTGNGGTPPLQITGTSLTGIDYAMQIASAQVKSCLLLAGLYAGGETRVSEPAPCRDHTERMLGGFGYPVSRTDNAVSLSGGGALQAANIDIPADISSAAFFLVAAAITPGASLRLEHVGINPTRIGIITLLRLMGASITIENQRDIGGEPVADLVVAQAALSGIEIPAEQIPLAIDEFPVLFVAAACAQGTTVLRGAEELRVKESDRIDAMAKGLITLGIAVETFSDGIRIEGGQLGQGEVDSFGDHRIAMAFVIAGLRASGPIRIRDCANVATSFPGFVQLASSVGIPVSQIAEQALD